MSVQLRLLAFAGLLAAAFGAAALVGSAADVHPPGRAPATAGPHGMAETGAMAPQAVRGLAASAGGLTLELARTTATPGRRLDLAFRIADRRGRTVRDFDVEHTRRMHFIVVRRDMTGFQHLHPAQAADGTWSVPVTPRDAGSYRVFADFAVDGRPQTLAGDLTVDGAMRARPLPAPARTADADGMHVSLTEGASRAG